MNNQEFKDELECRKYFTDIEETFVRCRGRNILLSPHDWSLMENWLERKVPAKLICSVIEKGFIRAKERNQDIRSLTYFKRQVEEEFAKLVNSEFRSAK